MGIVEKYSRATISSNLKDDEHHHQTEVLAAAALSGTLGSMLFRVKFASDVSSYQGLLEQWTAIVTEKAVGRVWPIDVSAKKIARLSLDHWLTDVCPACLGRGHLPHAGLTNVLSDDPCSACNGTAKRQIEAKHNLVEYVADMVEALENMTIDAGGEMIRKLADDLSIASEK